PRCGIHIVRRSRLKDHLLASLVDRASFWSCCMFRPRHFLSTSLVIAAAWACAGSASGASRIVATGFYSWSACCPLYSVHAGSLMVSDGSGGVYLPWVDGEYR